MVENQDIRGYINPETPGETEAGQRSGMSPDAEIYLEDRRGRAIEALIKSVRNGSIVEVKELHCLAPAEFRADKRRRMLTERIEAIKEAGGIIREWSTGHVSKGRMARMMMHAYEQIASSGRARRRHSTGRPIKYELTDHERRIMEGIWASRRYKNDDQRLVAIEKNTGRKFSRAWLRLKFGSPHKIVDPNTEPQIVPPVRRRQRAALVYFMAEGDKIKIGHSVNPKQRARGLKTHSPLKILLTLPGGAKRERQLHKQFSQFLIHGTKEWFWRRPEILKFIAEHRQKRRNKN